MENNVENIIAWIDEIEKLCNASVCFEVQHWAYDNSRHSRKTDYVIVIASYNVVIRKETIEELEDVLPLIKEEVMLKMKAMDIHKQAERKLIGR
jgi:hypothetical protein